ncbi:MAG TPA: hypothetical protein VNZ48_21720 [Xanthobacteraceae bacterium]|nr:hypothetical protein [Xanthobacteraceae bacterium]
MPALRIATAGAALLVLTAGSTIAQPTGTATSKPISILKILAPSDNAKIKPHGQRLGMATWRTHAVAAHQKARHLLAVAPAAAAQADIWADPEATRATQVAWDEPEQQGAAAAESAPSALLVGGRAVRIVSPDDANEIDLAADAPEVAASKGPRSDIAAAQPPEAETVAVAQAREPSAAGTSAWVAQLLAAIGGAMAAASVAWFLIGSAPQRTYD